MNEDYDLIVIGAGMAGVAAANKCGAAGWRVAIVDALPYGGTCALRGCDPKKILRRGAEIMDAARLMQGKGIDPGDLSINWADLMAHKRGFTDPVPDKMEKGLSGNGVETLHGAARFTGSNTLEVDGTAYQSERFLVAAGAMPRPLSFTGADLVIDSTDFLNLEALPNRVLFIGGGFVSFEFAHIAARAGANPIIVDRGARPLRGFDPDLVEMLIDRSGGIGVDLMRETEIVSVSEASRAFTVEVKSGDETRTIETDLVVHGAGRVAALADLNLEAAGVDYSDKGIVVAPHLQSTTNSAVFAAGDCADTDGMPLTPVAVIEGKVAASNMLKDTQTAPDYAGIPTAVFTVPEVARVGMLESEARDAGYDVDVRFTDTGDWYSNYRIGETSAAAKVLVDKSNGKILGAHLFGPEYGELINFFGLAIKLGLAAKQLKSMTAAYPSVGSDLGSLL
ncbi:MULTISPECIES: dihydrolipoyl dehydrogenase family protein [Rhodobacterales]|jgi:glutathione reductase (NADPH)|uniref:NAD(P)/FAD-dependent oxidoreductase n=10 Tax=Rhodobacterales TaxID=204455 RepID=A0A2H5F582_9RHOB|nr:MULTISPECIES: NAD(P)/FAD-dependent oxidoreductase [Rhodobacterales]MBR9840174.1 NAD(P)/FAD-dependent oxidoreductase [Paracoccaceae bacterium]QEW23698.1 Glutathione reductase [Marinibacterium anthonyi]AUH66711.1 NAD(P)/FAD-dependent oxidoreductase [Paracoccus zhejiangensis]EAU43629.1 regulatory protein [Salipiger bermudensis HTCC2601]KAB6716152.1 NAD(P)/FAD-dependent oxidoreductase [Roseobacter sp. TSBP12]|tara:strand:+ start:2185 stop:3537 length:1353 start_codon:yes stop_codon:yes gene_type:complete